MSQASGTYYSGQPTKQTQKTAKQKSKLLNFYLAFPRPRGLAQSS